MTYTRPELERLLSMAEQLDYADDVEHWAAELAALPVARICPECAQGKPNNCTGWVFDENDEEAPCSTTTS